VAAKLSLKENKPALSPYHLTNDNNYEVSRELRTVLLGLPICKILSIRLRRSFDRRGVVIRGARTFPSLLYLPTPSSAKLD